MPAELDPRIADRLVADAISRLHASPGGKILSTRRALHTAILAAVREAHEIGFLAGQESRLADTVRVGSPLRPSWMDIRLDDPAELARYGIHLKPIAIKSLAAAGYHCLGALRWVSDRQLRSLYYIGIRTAREIREMVRRLEEESGSAPDCGSPPVADP